MASRNDRHGAAENIVFTGADYESLQLQTIGNGINAVTVIRDIHNCTGASELIKTDPLSPGTPSTLYLHAIREIIAGAPVEYLRDDQFIDVQFFF